MTIIVTGASGNFGRAAVEGLLKRVPAQELILVTRNPANLQSAAKLGAQVRFGDFDDPSSLESAFKGGDKMLMISTARVGQRMPQHTNSVNAAVKAGVRHIHYTSFVNAVPENHSIAVRDHRLTEELLRSSGVSWTALRNSQYADAIIEAAAPLALQRGKWVSSTVEGRIAFIPRQTCVDCAVEILTTSGHENKIYNITGPELVSLREVAALASEISGKPCEYVIVTDEDMYAFFDSLGIPRAPVDDTVVEGVPWCSDDMVSFERTIREGQFAVISDDVKKLLGHPAPTLREFALTRREILRAA